MCLPCFMTAYNYNILRHAACQWPTPIRVQEINTCFLRIWDCRPSQKVSTSAGGESDLIEEFVQSVLVWTAGTSMACTNTKFGYLPHMGAHATGPNLHALIGANVRIVLMNWGKLRHLIMMFQKPKEQEPTSQIKALTPIYNGKSTSAYVAVQNIVTSSFPKYKGRLWLSVVILQFATSM